MRVLKLNIEYYRDFFFQIILRTTKCYNLLYFCQHPQIVLILDCSNHDSWTNIKTPGRVSYRYLYPVLFLSLISWDLKSVYASKNVRIWCPKIRCLMIFFLLCHYVLSDLVINVNFWELIRSCSYLNISKIMRIQKKYI